MRMRRSELRHLSINPGLWGGVARRDRLDRDPAINEAEDLGLIELRDHAYFITEKGRRASDASSVIRTCPTCKAPLNKMEGLQ